MIPDKIKIAGFIYDVEKKDSSFVSESGAALDGEHSIRDKRITVAMEGCREYQELVFLHEVCHAIIEAYVSPFEHEESFVEQFSKGLYQVLHDNPDIIK